MEKLNNTENQVFKAVNDFENRLNITFKPNKKFYQNVGINQKRWGQIIRGDKPMYAFEAVKIASFFKVNLETILN